MGVSGEGRDTGLTPVFFMALVMLFKIELIFPRSTLARFKGAGPTPVGVVTLDTETA